MYSILKTDSCLTMSGIHIYRKRHKFNNLWKEPLLALYGQFIKPFVLERAYMSSYCFWVVDDGLHFPIVERFRFPIVLGFSMSGLWHLRGITLNHSEWLGELRRIVWRRGFVLAKLYKFVRPASKCDNPRLGKWSTLAKTRWEALPLRFCSVVFVALASAVSHTGM